MFDYVRVEGHELPGLAPGLSGESLNESPAEELPVFQTKDMDNCLGTYVIKRGRLFGRSHQDRDLEYHGDLRFYALKSELGLAEERGGGLMEFRARFTHGDLEWIKPVMESR